MCTRRYIFKILLRTRIPRGKAEGMIDITEFYQQKKAFKDKQNILGFENWPNWIQFIIENDGLEIKIVDAKKKD